MARMLNMRQGGRVSLSATSLQTLLDGIASRLDETRETSRYLIGVLVFLGHQLGSFVGAFGGGVLFDMFGSYDVAWRLAVAMGLTAGVVQITYAIVRPTRLAPA